MPRHTSHEYMTTRKAFAQIAEAILEGGAKKATKFHSPTEVTKGTRVVRRRSRLVYILFTIGRPNYAERKFIKQAIQAGEPFPIKRLLLKFSSKRRVA